MKRKPVTGVMLAGLLAASMVLPAMAANANISMSGTADGYVAYRLLDLDTSLKSDHVDHDGQAHDDDCYNYHYTIPEGSKYAAAMKQAAGDANMSDADLLSYIENLNGDAAGVRAFADAVFKAIGDAAPDATTSDKKFADVQQGYYLIAESALSGKPYESRSLVMLSTAGHHSVVVTAKEGVPTLTKQVYEETPKGNIFIEPEVDPWGEGGGENIGMPMGLRANMMAGAWGDVADYDIGDDVPFRLTGTLPENFANYESYKYIFHDSLSSGLKLNEDSIAVFVNTADCMYELLPSMYTVRTTATADGCSFEVEISDLRALVLEDNDDGVRMVSAADQVIVQYDAELLASAQTGGAGNDNKAVLEFSNDPYDTAKTGKTPEDTVVAFTYKLVVNKVDGKGNPLAGANFELQKWDEAAGDYVQFKSINLVEGQTEFNFVGLDTGKYKLVETVVPAGYNKADDVEFAIVANYKGMTLTGLQVQNASGDVISNGEDATFSATVASGELATRVVNTTGLHLPSTGGRGVYLVYGAGGLALLGGAGMLVMKKRKEEPEA